MKKHLLATTAAITMVGGAASAQDWNVDVGGYFTSHVGFTSVGGTADNVGNYMAGTDFDGLQIIQDAEVAIVPSVTLDNGMTFGANIQYETADGSDMDEVYMFISSDTMGTIEIGNENSAGYKSMFIVPSVGGLPINTGSVSGFVPFATSGAAAVATGGVPAGATPAGPAIVNSFTGAGYSTATEVAGAYGNNDIARINYFTPSFNGLRVGVSYAPGSGSGSDGATALVDRGGLTGQVLSDIFDIGITYDQSFGTMDVSLAARWGTGSWSTAVKNNTSVGAVRTSDPETWGVGFAVTSGAFSIGAAYSENDNGLPGGLLDEEGYRIGMTYDLTGPWSVGLEYGYGEGSHGTNLTTGVSNGKDELEMIKLAASRDLGPGVNWSVWALQTKVDAADAATGGLLGGVAGTDVDATTIGTSIALNF
ncbi:porin [Roseobacter sp. AzwK-3b]|uniref:porin n=1 Tax=Roseobacter sp. AzwK-3b TaxID=351016 RepID=UPI001E4DEA19|nr:porin [Roseobacter sp. AzwK-3b]